MQNSMLHAAHIKINWQPFFQFFFEANSCSSYRVNIAEKIPGRADKSVHCVRFPFGLFPAFGAFYIMEFF